jgi:hypothetical protein
VNGLAELAANGEYHGNLRLENTYYQIVGDDFVVKLAGFTRKGKIYIVLDCYLQEIYLP